MRSASLSGMPSSLLSTETSSVPRHGEVLNVVFSVQRAAGIQQASGVGRAREGGGSDDWGRVEHEHFEDLAGRRPVVVRHVIHEFVGAAAIPRHRQIVARDVAVTSALPMSSESMLGSMSQQRISVETSDGVSDERPVT